MQLFLFLNDLAGRWPLLDNAMRFFYVSAVPLLATLLLAQLILLPRPDSAPSRSRIAIAVAFSLLLVAFLSLGVEWIAQSANLGTISPRPFMTRRINLLVVEPQDNSFPCLELAIAAVLAVGLSFSHRRWGIAGGILTFFLGIARLFCGTNYFADVMVGALMGVGSAAFFGALFEARWHFFHPKPALQFGFAAALLVFMLGGTAFCVSDTPRFAAKLPLLWGGPATASTSVSLPSPGKVPIKSTRAASIVLQEGEGVGADTEPQTAEELALSKRSHQFLPDVEKFLRGRLTPLARPFHLIDVEVAPVRAGDSSFRCAALRFEVAPSFPNVRNQTVGIAARLVKAAFAADSQLQNVDITAIVRGDPAKIDGSLLRFAGDEVPVFTASILRQNLTVAAPRWANAPNLDAGSWLRTRSRLYLNNKILPPAPAMVGEPIPTPIAMHKGAAPPAPVSRLTVSPASIPPKITAP